MPPVLSEGFRSTLRGSSSRWHREMGILPQAALKVTAITQVRWSAKGISRAHPGRAAGNPPGAVSSGRSKRHTRGCEPSGRDGSSPEPRRSAPPAAPARGKEERGEQAATAGRARRAQPFNPGSREVPQGRTARPAHRPPRPPGRECPSRASLGEHRPPPPRPPVPPERPQGC